MPSMVENGGARRLKSVARVVPGIAQRQACGLDPRDAEVASATAWKFDSTTVGGYYEWLASLLDHRRANAATEAQERCHVGWKMLPRRWDNAAT